MIIRADGSPSLVHADSTVDGFEYTVGKTLFYVYYGADYIGRNVALDTANKNAPVGYGYYKSANSQNRTIQEGTVGFNTTMWKNPTYGALNFIFQYSYLFRNPWYVAAGAPKDTHNNMVWIDLRYTLPGAPPSPKK